MAVASRQPIRPHSLEAPVKKAIQMIGLLIICLGFVCQALAGPVTKADRMAALEKRIITYTVNPGYKDDIL